ncbi:succinyl-diaminopimelate desuccinylase [Lentibacillus kapialis]|uniref:Succinyl-diaminopimelate desuccinylase n=1 Tax=Lentibacillus kapialis TaxID=340214 RepID=A0A917PYB0_9BACI|nr:M20 family metallopeptidase [Lentibacillus kapialis]GGJ99294.1 succinyl-diaminopimelate desuccinylase [Lentibacillus kapialis]
MKNLFRQVDIDRVIRDTTELIDIHDTAGDTVEITALYETLLKQAGFSVERYEWIPNNPTLVGRYRGHTNTEGKTLLFNGHMDVIPLEHKPPLVKDVKIYGRGACDMKGSLASILEVGRILKTTQSKIDGEIVVIANSMHESPGGRGEDLIKLAESAKVKADAAIVMEGATYDCTIAQLGSATFHITIEREGQPSHQLYTSSDEPHPITVLSDVIKALDQDNEKLKEITIEDIGHGSYFIGNVQSGAFYNQMPQHATLEGVRRYGPEESFDDVKQQMMHVLNHIAAEHGVDISLDMKKVRDGYRIQKNELAITSLQQAVKKVRGIDLPPVGKKLVTDAGIFAKDMEIPTVCYGPDQRKAHSEVEYVEISELEKSIQVYLQFIHEYLGIKSGIASG